MILERLKNDTRTLHDQVESVMGSERIFDPTYTPGEYVQLLQKLWLAHSALEPLIMSFSEIRSNKELQPELRFNKKELLESDLQELNSGIPEVLPANKTLGSYYEALGAAYVLEGSTLGGSVILKQLKKKAWNISPGLRYYNCYGDDTGKMWTRFRKFMLTEIPEDAHDSTSQVLNGARKAYLTFMDSKI